MKFEETPAIPVYVMPSQVGGTLAMYLRICLIFLVELVDLFYNILYKGLFLLYFHMKTTPVVDDY